MATPEEVKEARDALHGSIERYLTLCGIDGTLSDWVLGTYIQDLKDDKIVNRYDYEVRREQPYHHSAGLMHSIQNLVDADEVTIAEWGLGLRYVEGMDEDDE